MRKIYALLLSLTVFFTTGLNAQFSVTTNSGSGLAASYPSLAAAITALNGATITSPVIITCATGTETSPAGGYSITATGTLANTITIQGNGAANSIITAPNPAGTAGALNDAIFKIIGGDYITIQGFAMNENPANTTTAAASNNMVEWGVALLYASTTNGAQNCSILNNNITLNRTYQNTWGIYSNSTHSATSVSTSATATTIDGGNSGLKIYGNTISNVNQGICVVGPTAAADHNAGVDIGGLTTGNGNTISNYGTTGTFSSYANVSGTINGILVRNSTSINVSNNNITSSNGGATSGTMRGIFLPAFSAAPTATTTTSINKNTLSLTHGTSTTLQGIVVEGTTGNATTSLEINENNFTAFTCTVSSSGTFTVISNVMAHLNTNINGNRFTNITTNTTGSFTFITNSVTRPANSVCNVNNNAIVTAFNKTGAGGTVNFYTSNGTTPTTGMETNTGNNFSNITVTGATIISGWVNTDGPTTTPFGPSRTVTNNVFKSITGGTSAITILNVAYSNAGVTTNNVSGNNISNITGASTITAITSAGGNQNFFSDTINDLSTTGAATVTAISISGTTSTQNLYKNRIHDLTANNASGLVNAITINSGLSVNIYNNLIGNLFAPVTSNTNAVRGINILSTTASSEVNVYYNTIRMDVTSSATDFGASGVFHTYGASGVAVLTLRNNIIDVQGTPKGTGFIAALRRSAATDLNNYSTNSSNNLFFVGTPTATKVLYYDGTNADGSLAGFKLRVSPRENNSVRELPPYLSVVGTDPGFLHINPAAPTLIESGGTFITGITDDYDGQARNATTPDIGADEFNGTPAIPMSYSSATAVQQTGFAYISPNQVILRLDINTTGSASPLFATNFIVNANGTTSIANLTSAKIYYTGGSNIFSTSAPLFGTGSPSISNFSISGSQELSSGVNYFWLAYDIASGSTSGNLIDGEFINVTVDGIARIPTVSAPAGNKSILGPLAGNYNVGAGQTFPNFPTIKDAVADLHLRGISSNVTFTLINSSSTPYNTANGEIFPIEINEITGASATRTVTIRPGAGREAVITGSTLTGTALIKLNGADFIIFDGLKTGGSSLRIENTSTAANTSALWISSLGAGLGATNDTVRNCTIKAGSNSVTTTFGIFIGGTSISTTGAGADNNNLSITNNQIEKAYYGLYASGVASTGILQNLNVSNNSFGSNITDDYLFFRGLLVSNVNNSTFNDNSIFNLLSTTGNSPRGMEFGAGVTNSDIRRNKIWNITSTAVNRAGQGISVTTTAPAGLTIANNVIYGLNGHGSATATNNSWGLMVLSGGGYNIYFNSINVSDARLNSGTAPSGDISGGIYLVSGVTNLDIRNNVFACTTPPAGTGKTYAIYSLAANTAFTNINHNDYFTNNTAVNILGFLSSDRTNIGAWQTATGQDAQSISVDPLFNSSFNLRPAIGSPLVGAGDGSTGIAIDILGTVRGTLPTIGAYEMAGEFEPPVITYTPLSNTGSTADRTTVNFATINDPSGVNTTAGTRPRLYYKRLTDANTLGVTNDQTTNGWKWVETSNTSNTYNFTIEYSRLFGGTGVVVDNIVQYFVVAQDLAPSNNVGINSGVFNSAPSSVNLTSSAFPILGTINQYRIVPTLAGNLEVGPGKTYTSLTANGGLFQAINNSVVGGNITASITGDITIEDGTNALNEFAETGAGNWTLTIQPQTGGARVVSGTNATALIPFDGADRVTINGLNTGINTLTIRNAGSSGAVIRYINDATNNTVTNCIIEGGNTSTTSGLIVFGTSTGTVGNSNNSITNNIIRDRTDATGVNAIDIYSAGTAGALNSNNIITGNQFINFSNTGVSITANGNGNGWMISNNHFYNNLATNPSAAQTGINLASATSTNTTVSNNWIGGNAMNAVGTWTNTGNVVVTGIIISAGVAKVEMNTIANISGTNTGTSARLRAITNTSITAGVEILKNVIRKLSTPSTATGVGGGAPVVIGIYNFPASFTTVKISENTIDSISAASTSALTTYSVAAGIQIGNSGGEVSANKIFNIINKGTGTTAGQPPMAIGILARLFSGNVVNNFVSLGEGENTNTQFTGIFMTGVSSSGWNPNYYHNSIWIGGTAGGSISSFGFVRGEDTTTQQIQTVSVINNIFYMVRSGGGSVNYAIGNKGPMAASGWSSDYNILYNPSLEGIGFWNNTGYNLAGWQTVSSAVNSKSVEVFFMNPAIGDLHLTGSSRGNNQLIGTPLASVPIDIDGDLRSASFPYIGADETTPPLPLKITYFNGYKQGTAHMLNWKVSCNTSVKFEIERSADARKFGKLGTVNASALDCNNPFNFADNSPLDGINYYRLKITEANGNWFYSPIVALINKKSGFEIVGMYPTVVNEGKAVLNTTAVKNTNLFITVTDATGRVIKQMTTVVNAGSGLISLDLNSLPAGMYQVTGRTEDDYMKTIRFVKQ